jgi:hypothetical protein
LNKRWLAGAAIICLFLAGCTAKVNKTVPWEFGKETFIFIELRVAEDGKVIQGNYPPGRNIDGPAYNFDERARTLEARHISHATADSLKVILGRRLTLRGAAGGGVASRLFGVFKFPYENEEVILNGVDRNGRAYVQYLDKELIIESESEWVYTVTRRDTVDIQQYSAIAEFTTTTRIINYGVLDKSMIRTW